VTEDEWKAREYEQSRRRWWSCTGKAVVVALAVALVIALCAGSAQ